MKEKSASYDTEKGAAVYSSLVLKIYDWWVLGISNRYAWKCSTSKVLLPFFRQHAGERHLDVGVGTGFYPAESGLPVKTQFFLLDLNSKSLHTASRRLGQHAVELIHHDVMAPLPAHVRGDLDSISLFYLLYCLPGTMVNKATVFASLKSRLSVDGVLYGATILGNAAGHNAFGRRLMALYNKKGIFSNRSDSREALELALGLHFANVKIRVVGCVALFEARQPL